MTDTDNFKKVIEVLIDSPKAFRLDLTIAGKWYNTERNRKDHDFLVNLDWAIRELVSNGDYGISVWSQRPEVRNAWCVYHEQMAKHYIDKMMDE